MKTTTAMFDSNDQARNAIDDLVTAGVSRDSISFAGHGNQVDSRGDRVAEALHVDPEADVDADKTVGGALTGGAVGAVLGVAALMIPGVGPLAAAGAIAASAVPAAAATGGIIGAGVGGLTGALKDNGYDDDDAAYYSQGIERGGIMLTVRDSHISEAEIDEILQRNGGHRAGMQRADTMTRTTMDA